MQVLVHSGNVKERPRLQEAGYVVVATNDGKPVSIAMAVKDGVYLRQAGETGFDVLLKQLGLGDVLLTNSPVVSVNLN